MPEALSIDKELVKGLVLQGFSNKEVCLQTGVADNVLRAWKCRYGWNKTLNAMRSAMEVVQVKKAQSAMSERSEQIKEGIASELVADLQVIKSKPAKSLLGASVRQQVLSTMASTAKTVFGWGDQGSSTTFNTFNFSARTVGTIEPIDIKSELVEPKQVTPPPEQ